MENLSGVGPQKPWFVREYATAADNNKSFDSSSASSCGSGGGGHKLICSELFHKYFDGLPHKLPFKSVQASSNSSQQSVALDEALRLAALLDDRFSQRIVDLM
jgi:hypothetical protein